MADALPGQPILRNGRELSEQKPGTSGRLQSLQSLQSLPSLLPNQFAALAWPPGCEGCSHSYSIPRMLLLSCLISLVLFALQFLVSCTGLFLRVMAAHFLRNPKRFTAEGLLHGCIVCVRVSQRQSRLAAQDGDTLDYTLEWIKQEPLKGSLLFLVRLLCLFGTYHHAFLALSFGAPRLFGVAHMCASVIRLHRLLHLPTYSWWR
jgi:hypothetical protein